MTYLLPELSQARTSCSIRPCGEQQQQQHIAFSTQLQSLIGSQMTWTVSATGTP
jgi:hypothetical protein